MRRVVVTGIGLVTPLASGVDETWKRLIAGESGAGSIQKFDTSDFACRIACEVPLGDGAGLFNADHYVAPKDQKKVDQFIVFGMAAGAAGHRRLGMDADRRGIPYQNRRIAGFGDRGTREY